MTRPSTWFCTVAVFCLYFAHAEQSQIEASQTVHLYSLKLADAGALGRKPAPAFELRDPDTFAMIDPDSTCPFPSNCLIRLCRVASNGRLTGYCLTGSRGGICHQSYNPTSCPPGATARSRVSKQCGPSRFIVDATRPCS